MSLSTLANKPEHAGQLFIAHGSKKVTCQVSQEADCNIFRIALEDHTLGNLINQQLCEDPMISFAAYRMPHPLDAILEITLRPKGYAGVKLFSDNVNQLIQEVIQMQNLYKDEMKRLNVKMLYTEDVYNFDFDERDETNIHNEVLFQANESDVEKNIEPEEYEEEAENFDHIFTPIDI